MNVPYQNVFDKKYCKPITDKLQIDIILMTKLEQATRTGQITRDRWSFQIKIYNTKTEKQFLSLVTGDKLTSADIESLIKSKRQDLSTEIKNIR
jgi:Cft2 family RNA processing exonuclease